MFLVYLICYLAKIRVRKEEGKRKKPALTYSTICVLLPTGATSTLEYVNQATSVI
tara:strand:- start:1738 stop:1902 length:165 start_codon:yes stop_codon:yes gene_type:complete